MKTQFLAAALLTLLVLFFPRGGARGQSIPDLAEVQVQAALQVIQEDESGWDVFLDPRPELRTDSVASLVFDSLASTGFPVYDRPDIPGPGVWLLSFWRVEPEEKTGERGPEEGPTVSVGLQAFHPWSPGSLFIDMYRNGWHFRVICGEGECTLGEPTGLSHADGSIRTECREDYFARSAEERKGC